MLFGFQAAVVCRSFSFEANGLVGLSAFWLLDCQSSRSNHKRRSRLFLGSLGMFARKLVVRQQHDAVKNESNKQRAANQPHKGRASITFLSLVSAHDCLDEEVLEKARLLGVGHAHGLHGVVCHEAGQQLDTRRDLAEHRMNVVQMARVGLAQHHKELAPAGVLASVGH